MTLSLSERCRAKKRFISWERGNWSPNLWVPSFSLRCSQCFIIFSLPKKACHTLQHAPEGISCIFGFQFAVNLQPAPILICGATILVTVHTGRKKVFHKFNGKCGKKYPAFAKKCLAFHFAACYNAPCLSRGESSGGIVFTTERGEQER